MTTARYRTGGTFLACYRLVKSLLHEPPQRSANSLVERADNQSVSEAVRAAIE